MTTFCLRPDVKQPDNCEAASGIVSFLVLLLLSFTVMPACGGGGASLPVPEPPMPHPPGSIAVLVNLGGFASVPDQIVSFAVTIESVALRSSAGDVELLHEGTFRRFELARQSLRLEPLAFREVAQGDYSAIVIAISNPRISFVDVGGVLHENVAASLVSPTQTINLPFSISSTPVFFNLTLSRDAVSFGGGDVVSVTPRFTSFGPAQVQNGVGIVNGLVGRVTRVGTKSLGIAVGNDLPCCFSGEVETFTFATDSNTEFQGLTGIDTLAEGMTIDANATLYADGTLRANKVELENNLAGATMFEGVSVVVAPAQLRMLVRDVHGPYIELNSLPVVGEQVTVNANASTQFRIESENVDLTNLDFSPMFDVDSVAPGQNVRVAAPGASGTIAAEQVKLEEQSLEGVAGTLRSGSVPGQASFPLNFRAASAVAKMSGSNSVIVVVQPSTWLDTGDVFAPCISCVSGKAVRVRGLLFYSGRQYRLIASEVSTN